MIVNLAGTMTTVRIAALMVAPAAALMTGANEVLSIVVLPSPSC
ncbi:MAG: hypothetical protein ABL952_18260 [Pyrinomonadaceae bacterium]